MQRSGVFNTLLPVAPIGSRAGFASGTWNARSFFCREPYVFNWKLQLLEKQIKIHNIFCLQEVRGSDALVKKHLRLIARTHWIFCNFSSGRKNAGGVITFFSKSSVPDEACVHHTPLVAGRVSRLLIKHVGNDEIGPVLEPGGPNSSDFSTVSGTDLGHKNHPTVPPGVPLSGGTVEGDFPGCRASNSAPFSEPTGGQSDNFQIIYNIHYHDIVGGDSVALCNSIKNDIDLCAIDPINSNLVLSGDFNLSSTIGKAYSFSDPVPVAITDTKKAPCTGN